MKPTKSQLLAMNEHLERLRKEAQSQINERNPYNYLEGYYTGAYCEAVRTYWLFGFYDFNECLRRTQLLDYHLNATEPMG